MKGIAAIDHMEFKIKYYHAAQRYLRENDPVGYVTADIRELERIAEFLRYEDYRRHINPYLEQKAHIINDFYNRQVSLVPLPDWLQEHLAEWDKMIAIEAMKFGYKI